MRQILHGNEYSADAGMRISGIKGVNTEKKDEKPVIGKTLDELESEGICR